MESFKEYLLQNKTVDFKFKGVDYHITIAGADVFPQGYSAIASRVSEFSGMNMLADIGNGTMNIMNINNGNPDIQNCFTEKFGTYQCTLKIKENMMKKHHANIDEDIITEFLCTGTADVLEDYLVTMRETAKEYVSEIFRRLREHKLEQSKARVDEIDRVLTKLYEDNALGKITDERFERLSATYEKEQRELADCIIESETEITEAEQDNVDLKYFLKAIRACTDLKELTPEIVNTLIKRINVHNAEKVDGRKKVKIDIEFIAVGLISIPDEKELLTLIEEIRNEKVA